MFNKKLLFTVMLEKQNNDSKTPPSKEEEEKTTPSEETSENKKIEEASSEISSNDNEATEKKEEESSSCKKEEPKEEIEIEDPDDYLMYLEEILRRIHTEYYKEYDETGNVPIMRDVIPKMRRKVLEGQCIVFSGVVPTHVSVNNSRYAQIARKLGASVAEQVYNTHFKINEPNLE